MNVWLHTGKGVEAYLLLEDKDEITWASNKKTKKGDIVFMYRGYPHSDVSYIFKAKGDAYEDEYFRKRWKNASAVDLYKKISIPQTIKIDEMRKNQILGKWGVVRKNFMGSFFEVPNEEYNELKRLILNKNPQLKDKIENFEHDAEEPETLTADIDKDYYDINAGRAHIVRDICYLIYNNDDLTEKELFNLLRESVGDDEDYWRAYYQRSNKNNSPRYNLNSARTLNLVYNTNKLELTDLGIELISNISKDEIFTYNYSLEIKQFFYEFALNDDVIRRAMEILKEKKKLRFWSPTCDLTNKTMWNFHENEGIYFCDKDKYPECKTCDRDLLAHIKESSLPFETYKETGVENSGFVFWMCSRVTPMHLTGTKPGYSGYYIYWDEEAEKELGYRMNTESQIPKIWKITPGSVKEKEQKKLWPVYKENGFIGIGWLHDSRSYLEFQNLDELKQALYDYYPYFKNRNTTQAAKMVWDFTHNIKNGDLIVANAGRSKILGIGIVESDYIEPKNPENPGIFDYFWHLRKVNWVIDDEITMNPYFFDMKTVTELNERKWSNIKETYIKQSPEYQKIFEEIEKGNIPESMPNCPPVFIKPNNIKTTLKINPNILDQSCGTLNSKKHILLTGAPGTGKTNLAEDICKVAHDLNFADGYILTTATSDWTTFDTIGGYMPDEQGMLLFEDGKFLQSIKENKWLIIDEINRADIDKAFGQLFTVLSGQGVELPFKNNGESVKIQPCAENRSYYDPDTSTYKVGKNWRIISTMNVYDKDYLFEMSYAFMRRFTFIYIDLPNEDDFIDLIDAWSEDLGKEPCENIKNLLKINEYRQIGPAIFKDITEYAKERQKLGNNDHVIEDATMSYILPQFEGLDDIKIHEIWNILKDTFGENEEIKSRLEEISSIELN